MREGMRRTPWRIIPAVFAAALLSMPLAPVRSASADRLIPFIVPWDEASAGPTDLSGWNRPIEGEPDRLRPGPDGHLYRGPDRVRLFGYDLSSGAPFPDQAVGERVAARLARLGVNYVRIAQNSNPAPAGWLDPATAATLDPEALARLDDFIAQLRRRGIYVHLVLNHFRRVYPPQVPGFEARRALLDGWPRSGTGVTQFYPPVIAQNRAVARQLLTHRNRRTGLTYAEDPAIAIVEVTNEDGLVRSWRDGALDPIIAAGAPHLDPLRDDLRARWNGWLRARFPSDAAVRAAWLRGASSGGGELIANGDFRAGEQGWRFETRGVARARFRTADTDGPVGGNRALVVQVDRVDAEAWHVMVSQDHLRLEEGRPYRISLWARAARPGARISVNVQQAQAPHRVLISRSVEWTLTDQWNRYTEDVAPTATEANAKLNIIAGNEVQTIWITDVSVREEAVAGLREDESPARGTVLPFSRAGLSLRTLPAQRDWMAFLFGVEGQFFTGMFRFLKDDLHVRSLLVGTQGDYSPAAAQAGSDITSMHGYWSHPSFPGRPWDPDNWFVRNRSMANARDEWYTLNRIAFHHWRGKPLVVDEYNHPQPNTFGAEGLPLAAAYGAFQDWDGIAGWAYREGWGTRWLSQEDWARPVIRNYFALDTDPVRLLSAWLAAVMFRRGDVAPGTQLVSVSLGAEQEQEIARTIGLAREYEVAGRGGERVPLRHRVAFLLGPLPGPLGTQDRQPPEGTPRTPVASDTAELAWQIQATGGVITVNTPRTKAVIGFGGGTEFSLGAVTLRPGPTAQRGFGVWAVTALDGPAPVEGARRLVIVALGYSQNTSQGWQVYPGRQRESGPPPEGAAVTLGTAWGEPPVLAEGVPASIALPATTGRVHVWALDERGQRKEEVPVRKERGQTVVEIGARYRTLWYEVVVPHDAP